jgi:ATP-dependent RNA helicase DeaD
MTDSPAKATFASLNLPSVLERAISAVGYEVPSEIQQQTIPPLLAGHDVIGQAQTGTGKTAAFALPILSLIDCQKKHTQCLVLAPTRELAIQVAEAFQTYAKFLPGFQVAPIYGGTDYRTQLRQLERGAQVIVGTPGRVMDHMRKGSLKLDKLAHLVLDEADEMLRMGFIDDVEWVLSRLPEKRQIALFSATMPSAIRRIANEYLINPQHITVKQKTVTATSIRQRVWMISGTNKLDALTRILEVEDFEGIIVFARTKIATTELADKLQARGFSAAALNGDMAQGAREQVISQLKSGRVDIVVATDVAARGLDVDRITHVVNYDIPQDPEAYVHRIGRTGRAGRSGQAILFAANREQRLLKMIERTTGQPIEVMTLPTLADVADRKVDKIREQIAAGLARKGLSTAKEFAQQLADQLEVGVADIAAVLLTELGYTNQPAVTVSGARLNEKLSSDNDRGKMGHKRPKSHSKGKAGGKKREPFKPGTKPKKKPSSGPVSDSPKPRKRKANSATSRV